MPELAGMPFKIIRHQENTCKVSNMGKIQEAQLTKKRSQIYTFQIVFILITLIIITSLITHLPTINNPELVSEKLEVSSHQSKYHDSLKVDLDLEKYPKLWKAENIWSRSADPRGKFGMNMYSHHLPNLIHYFPPSFNCPHYKERVGSGQGSKWVCGLELYEKIPECVIYSFGVSDQEATFEAELLQRTAHCHIFAYDFGTTKLGTEIDPSHSRVTFQSLGIGAANDNFSKTLRTLMMYTNDHGWIDILKIDVGEDGFSVLAQIMEDFDVLPFGQLLITLNLHPEFPFEEYYKWFDKLEQKGLRPFHGQMTEFACEEGRGESAITLDYAFVNIRGKHLLVKTE